MKTTQLTPENANMIRQQLAQLWTPPPPPGSAAPGYPQGGISQAMPMGPSSMPPNMAIPPQHLHQQPPIPQPSVSSSMAAAPPFPGAGVPPPHFAPHLQPPPGSVPSPQGMMAPLPTSMPILPGNLPMSGAPGMSMPPGPPMPLGTAPLANGLPPPQPLPPTVVPTATGGPGPAPVPSVVPPAASDLLASLMQSGLLGPNGTLAANLNRASPSPAAATPPLPNLTLDRTGQSEQDQSVMSLGLIELTSQDIQR